MDEESNLVYEIRALNKTFHQACAQVIILNRKITFMKTRYDRARSDNHRSFRYTNRLKLCALEGVRNMYYEFACRKCDEIETLQEKLQALTGRVVDFESSTSELEESGETDDDDSQHSQPEETLPEIETEVTIERIENSSPIVFHTNKKSSSTSSH